MVNKKIAVYGIIVATYTAISLLMSSFSFGIIQIRVAEALLVLCLYDKQYILPITIGCFVTNLVGIVMGTNLMIIDLFIGTLATFLSGICVYCFAKIEIGNIPLLSLLLPAIINGIMVGMELHFYFPVNIFLSMVYVGLGEFVSVTILGLLIYRPIGRAIKSYEMEWYN